MLHPVLCCRCILDTGIWLITMRQSRLYYRTGFVLDDFAQMQANLSVQSVVKVGQAELGCQVGQVY